LEEVANSSKIADQSPEAEILEAEEELQRNEKFLILQKSITMLPIKYQEVITLRFFENKQVKEISEILGKREGTIKSLLHRGLEKLGSLLT
jgi:RNA polymerase sigma-70 factor (ECF subfamily)